MSESGRASLLHPQDEDWRRLIALISVGDQVALASLYDKTSPRVYGLALRMLRDPAAAEEVTLDVYMQVWTKACHFDPNCGTATSWLLLLARSRAIDRLRGRLSQQRWHESLDSVEATPDIASDPLQNSADGEMRGLVHRALSTLTSAQRESIELAYFQGLSHREIAAKTRQPLGTVKTRIRVGMSRLRELLCPIEEGHSL